MDFLNRVSQAIANKQVKCMNNLEGSAEYFLPQDPASYFSNLSRAFFRNVSKKMDGHGQNISNYLFRKGLEDLQLEKLTSSIGHRQQKALQSLGQNFGRMLEDRLDISTYETVERPVRIEKETQIAFQPQQQKNSSQHSQQFHKPLPPKISEDPEPSQQQKKLSLQQPKQDSNYQSQSSRLNIDSHKKDVKDRLVPEVFYDKSLSLQERQHNPEHVHMAASEVIEKRDIVKQLQEKRKRLAERELKSKQLKNKIIKLEPLARKEDKALREKEAKDKLFAGIEFVRNIQNSKKTTNIKVTEWRQDRLKTAEKVANSPPKQSFRKLEPLRGADIKDFQGLAGSKLLGESSIKRTEKIASRGERGERGEKNFTLKKPMPYNLYNVSMTKEEVFQLKYK